MKRESKYKNGDCICFRCADGKFIAALITGLYKLYYDITLIEYQKDVKPDKIDVENARFFGTREGAIEDIDYLVDKVMIKKSYVDKSENIELVCSLNISENLGKASYFYLDDIGGLLKYYSEDLPIRKEKTQNADKFPDIGFMSKHLINVSLIVGK